MTILVAALLVFAVGLAALKIEGERRAPSSDPKALAGEFARSGDYQNAANTLRAAFRAQPSEKLRLEAARAYLVAGDNYAALELLKEHSTESALEFSRRHLYAEALVRARRYDAAASEAELLAASSGGDGRARLLLARIAYGLGDFDRAGRELGDAIRIGGPSLGEAWLFRARVALNDNNIEAARAAAARAGTAGAPAAALRALEIEALARGGNYVGAKAGQAALAATDDDLARLLAAKLAAFLDASVGRYEEAARRLRDIGAIVEADPYGDLFIARVAGLAGDAAQSAAGVEKALEASPDNSAIAEAGIDKLIEAGRLDEASASAASLIARDPPRGRRAAMRVARVKKDWDGLARLALSAPPGRPPSSVDAMLFGARSVAAGRSAEERAADAKLLDTIAAALESHDGKAAELALGLAGDGADAAALLVAAEILTAANSEASAGRAFTRAATPAALIGLARLDVRSGDLAAAERRLSREQANSEIALARARAIARQGRIEDAASILAPLSSSWTSAPEDAVFAAHIFAQGGAPEPLAALTAHMRRKFPDALETAEVLFLAGRGDDALSVARASVLAAPADPERAARYADIARRLDRVADAKAFLAELTVSSGENEALASAVRFLDGAPPPETETPVQVREARNAYLQSVRSSAAAYAYADALTASGEPERAVRLVREGCFWSASATCADRQ